jgi:germination protein, Ger(x)C family
MKIKKALQILLILSMVFITGCWNSKEVNNIAISVCMGIDKIDNGYMLTVQIINPKVIASKKTVNESPVILYTDTGSDLFEIMRKLTTQCPRKIYSSHMRMVVFGEEVAREGIQDIIDYLARDHDFRTDFYFIVAKDTTAKSVLSTLTRLEAIPGIEMYNSLKASEKNWAPTKSIRIVELINSIAADGKNPVITGIEVTDGANNSDSVDVLKQTGSIKKLKYTYLGAFKKDKLIGWLNENESKGYNYMVGNVKSTVGYVYVDNKKITIEVLKTKSDIKVSMEKDKPVVEVKIKITCSVSAVDGDFDVTKEENLNKINKEVSEKTKLVCEKVLEKAQGEFKADIFGFGEAIHRQYPALWAELKDNWNEEFISLPVNIKVETETKRLGQITKPIFMKEKE